MMRCGKRCGSRQVWADARYRGSLIAWAETAEALTIEIVQRQVARADQHPGSHLPAGQVALSGGTHLCLVMPQSPPDTRLRRA